MRMCTGTRTGPRLPKVPGTVPVRLPAPSRRLLATPGSLMRKHPVAAALALVLAAPLAAQRPVLISPQPAGEPPAGGAATINGVDLRPQIAARGLDVRDQGGRPTCTIFASAFLIEYMQSFTAGAPGPHASIEYLNWAANEATGSTDDGGYFEDVVAGYDKWGEVAEGRWPYTEAFAFTPAIRAGMAAEGVGNRSLTPEMIRPNDGTWGISDAVLQQMILSLNAGVPVAAGFRLSSHIQTVELDSIVAWDGLADLDGLYGHSMAIVGYQVTPAAGGGGYFIVRNSGSPTWGDHGYLYASFDYVRKNVADVLAFRGRRRPGSPTLITRATVPAHLLPTAPPSVLQAAAELSRRRQ
jgi:hypothetical protein